VLTVLHAGYLERHCDGKDGRIDCPQTAVAIGVAVWHDLMWKVSRGSGRCKQNIDERQVLLRQNSLIASYPISEARALLLKVRSFGDRLVA
jgi:hypothetical protein